MSSGMKYGGKGLVVSVSVHGHKSKFPPIAQSSPAMAFRRKELSW